uniref:Uncharacterized protein n=1 Tax=Glossina palpalis gambiensis TaxID=67801 RepID=A0A1B0C759_9MUSC
MTGIVLSWYLSIQKVVDVKAIAYYANSNICLIHAKFMIYRKAARKKL